MEILLKELELADAIYEHEIMNLLGVDEFESLYMKESGESSGKGFFQKLIRIFKEFVDKIKTAIRKKMEDRKFKKAIEMLKSSEFSHSIKSIDKTIKLNGSEKEYRDLIIKHSKDCYKLSLKISECKDNKEQMKKYEKEYLKLVNEFDNKIEAISNKVINKKIEFVTEHDVSLETIDRISKEIEESEEKIKNLYKKNEEDENYKKMCSHLVNAGKKSINFISKNKKIVCSVVIAVGTIFTAKTIHQLNNPKLKYPKINKTHKRNYDSGYYQRKMDELDRETDKINDIFKTFRDIENDIKTNPDLSKDDLEKKYGDRLKKHGGKS